MAATSYEDRLQLIAAQLSYLFPFLFDDGREAANQDNDQIELSEYSDDVLGTLAHSSNMSDPDSGPSDVWRWTHQQSSRAGFVFSTEHTQLREFGYVMWDRKRLLEHDLLSTQWMNPRRRPYDPDEYRRRQDDMSRSFDLRSEIWRRGGRGWWAEGDESKVVWPVKRQKVERGRGRGGSSYRSRRGTNYYRSRRATSDSSTDSSTNSNSN